MGMNTGKYFYKDKPLFGLDIGFSSVKVMQVVPDGNQHTITGYGVKAFDNKAIDRGVIVNHEIVAKAIQELFQKDLVGEISTRRAAFSVPAARTFSRILLMPKLDEKDLAEAVRLEAEQYIPVPIDELYLDYTVIRRTEKNIAVMAVAAPKKLVDSYSLLGELLGLEIVTMDTTTAAGARLFDYTDANAVPTLLIDFGSVSADIMVYDKGIVVTNTVPGGGDDVTNIIAKTLGVSHEEGHEIKTKYGLSVSKKQKQITEALAPMLSTLTKEIRRMLRYYEERAVGGRKIEQVVTFGGGANVPGLSEYLIDQLRMPVRACDPWNRVAYKHISPPNKIEQTMYITVAGLALIEPGGIFS